MGEPGLEPGQRDSNLHAAIVRPACQHTARVASMLVAALPAALPQLTGCLAPVPTQSPSHRITQQLGRSVRAQRQAWAKWFPFTPLGEMVATEQTCCCCLNRLLLLVLFLTQLAEPSPL